MKTLMSGLLITSLLGFLKPLAAQDMFENADFDRNDVLVFSEITAVLPTITKELFDKVDQSGDGVLDYDEYSLGYSQGFFRPRRFPRSMNLTVSKEKGVPGS